MGRKKKKGKKKKRSKLCEVVNKETVSEFTYTLTRGLRGVEIGIGDFKIWGKECRCAYISFFRQHYLDIKFHQNSSLFPLDKKVLRQLIEGLEKIEKMT